MYVGQALLIFEYHCLNARQSGSNQYAVTSIKENRHFKKSDLI